MMDNRNLFGIAFLLAMSLLFSCDTAENIDDPSKNYFIKYFGNDGSQEGIDVVVAADGSIYLLGNTTSKSNGQQIYLVKADGGGKMVWEKTFGGKYDEVAKDLELTTDRLIILGNTQKGSTESDILVMSVSLDGIKMDSVPPIGFKTILNEEADDVASSISLTIDGFIITGTTTSVKLKGNDAVLPEDVSDALQIRLNSDLTPFLNWTSSNGTVAADGSVKAYQVNASLFYVFGYTNAAPTSTSGITNDYNFYIYSLGAFGDSNKGQLYPGAVATNDKLSSVIISPIQSGEGFLLVGTSQDASGNYDVFVSKLRKDINFNNSDYLFNKPLSIPLGKLDASELKVSALASASSGYLILTNQKSTGINNFYLTKIDNGGNFAWTDPQSLIFGEQKNNDYIGAVAELPDGKIILVGTMSIGDEGQKKMALIKVNKDGKFLD